MNRIICGKKTHLVGVTPAIGLVNPKYPHNVGAAVRAASCFGVDQVWFTGDRIKLEEERRIPREERMKGYAGVTIIQHDLPIERFDHVTPVAIEVRPNSELLTDFEHPEDALYLFGPEDGSIPKSLLRCCHRFVMIPTRHCTNLSAAVYLVLYDRLLKRQWSGLEEVKAPSLCLDEDRGWWNYDDVDGDLPFS
jgi:tRNA(Leu) C34 or U34 (ribose-2'-O)-methylase TrmL